MPLPVPAFVPVLDSLSSGVVGTAAVTAPGPPPLQTEALYVGAGTSSFCATTVDVAAGLAFVEPPLGPWTGCEALVVDSSPALTGCAVGIEAAARLGESCACGNDDTWEIPSPTGLQGGSAGRILRPAITTVLVPLILALAFAAASAVLAIVAGCS